MVARRGTPNYTGAEYQVDFLPKVKLEIATADENVEGVIEAICKAAYTGKIGDGKIFVYDLLQAVRIRTGESDDEALLSTPLARPGRAKVRAGSADSVNGWSSKDRMGFHPVFCLAAD